MVAVLLVVGIVVALLVAVVVVMSLALLVRVGDVGGVGDVDVDSRMK